MGMHVITSDRHRRLSAAGFSLVEVMLAVGVLVIASASVVGVMANLHAERGWSGDLVMARQVATSLCNNLQGMNWDDLNDHTKPDTYLCWARHPDADGVANDTNYLGDDPTLPLVANSTDPLQRRRLPFRTGLADLRIYLEYFRGQTARDENGVTLVDAGLPCQGGLLENPVSNGATTTTVQREAQNGLGGFSVMATGQRIPLLGQPTGVAPIRLPLDETIASQVGVRLAEFDPVAVRITITWRDRSNIDGNDSRRQMLTVITGKTR